jgi:uncharacterized membrane protein YidH (DUF202 family)
MKRGIAAAGSTTLGVGLLEAILALAGIVRFGGTQYFDREDKYLSVPHWGIWVYIAIPVVLGAIVFFSTWEDKLDDDERRHIEP